MAQGLRLKAKMENNPFMEKNVMAEYVRAVKWVR